MNNEELYRQLCGIHEPQQPLLKVVFHLLERRLIADILSDLDEDLPEDEIARRKGDATNALVSYVSHSVSHSVSGSGHHLRPGHALSCAGNARSYALFRNGIVGATGR